MDLHAALRDPELLALRVAASELFGILTRRVQAPSTFAALVLGDNDSTTLAPAGLVESAHAREVCFVRTTAIPLQFVIAANSQDQFACSTRLHLTVHVVPDKADVESFIRTIVGSARRVTVPRLLQHFLPEAQRRVRDYVGDQPAEPLLAGQHDATFSQQVQAALKPLAFSAGMAIAPGVVLQVESPAYDAHRRERRDAESREQRAAEQARVRRVADRAAQEHAASVAGLMQRVSDLAANASDKRLADLIRGFNPGERAELYRLHLERGLPTQSATAIVVAGNELLWIDAMDGLIRRRRTLAGTAGALRSIRISDIRGEPVWLIGAAVGVHLYYPRQDREVPYAYDPPRKPRGGMNAAVVLGEYVYASHSELGVIRWPLTGDRPGEAILTELTTSASSVRDIQADAAGVLWLSVSDRVLAWSQQDEQAAEAYALPGETSSPDVPTAPGTAKPAHAGTLVSMASVGAARGGTPAVSGLCVTHDTVFAGANDGRLLEWPKSDGARLRVVLNDEGGCVDSVAWFEQDGVERLLVTTRRAYATLLVRGDTHRVDYRTDDPVRWAGLCAGSLVALNDRRDRLYIWSVSRPEKPQHTVHVARSAGHSVQDVAMVVDCA